MHPRLGIGPEQITDMPREALPALLAELAAVQTAVAARLAAVAPVSMTGPGPGEQANRDLTVAEAAERLRKTPRWVVDNWRRKGMPGKKRGRTTVFPEAELQRWMKRA